MFSSFGSFLFFWYVYESLFTLIRFMYMVFLLYVCLFVCIFIMCNVWCTVILFYFFLLQGGLHVSGLMS